jgi:hypothetical protein
LILAEAEKRVELLRKVLGIAIKRTNPKDWVDQQGHPYLTASGAEKIAPLFGVKMTNLTEKREDREDEKGKYYIYTFKATFSWKAGEIEAIGTCSSRDKFFAWDSQKQEWKPLSEFDETNIKKAAYSNLIVNGITRVLGIRNLTWEDLEAYGIKREDVAKVEYKITTAISDEEKKKQLAISKMISEMANNNQAEAEKILLALSTFIASDGKEIQGVRNPKLLTGKRLDVVYGKCKEQYKKVFGKEVEGNGNGK